LEFLPLASPSGVNLRAEDVFNKTVLVRGVIALKRRMSTLPVGATIFWLDRILGETARKPKESEKLTYPPASIIEQVRRYAEARRVEVQVLRRDGDKRPVKPSCHLNDSQRHREFREGGKIGDLNVR